MTFITINVNTDNLANVLFRSIEKNVKSIDYDFCIIQKESETFDLRDGIKRDIRVLTNIHKELFDEDSIVDECGGKIQERFLKNRVMGHGSMRHAIGIQWIIDNFDADEVLLFDTDVIVKKDFDFLDDRKQYITIGKRMEERFFYKDWPPRIHPCLQYLNLDMIRKNGIKYFDGVRFRESKHKEYMLWDTGASFLADIEAKNLPYKNIDFKKYAIHCQRASWSKNMHDSLDDFLKKYNKYYE